MPRKTPTTWEPKTKTQEHMLPKYRAMTAPERMREAVKLVQTGVSQSRAARDCGVSRNRLNQKVLAARKEQDEREARAAAARAARAGTVDRPEADLQVPRLEVSNEIRRVPPIDVFVRTYFDNLICPDCDVHHEPQPFHDEIMNKIVDPAIKRLLINVPPYHSKSTNGTVMTTVYELCRDPNNRTAIISKSSTLAGRFVRQIANFLTNPDLYEGASRNLIDDWGPFNDGSSSWSRDEIYVCGRQGHEKDPSVAAYGIGTQIYGTRWDRILCDDIADLENQKNPDRVSEMLVQITQEFQSRVGRSGKLIVLGTRVSAGDIYYHLKDLPAYEVIRYPAIVDEEGQLTLWPGHFGYKDAVLQRNSMSFEQFELVYQNSDMPAFGASFTQEHLERAHDPERGLGHVPDGTVLIIGLDPAGANAQAGFTALVLWGLDVKTGRRYLVDLVNVKQMKAPQLRDQLFDWADRYPRIVELRVESNGLQSQLVQYNQEIQAYLSNKGIKVTPHITHGHNKWDPQFGVEAMSTLFHNGMVSLPTLDINSRNKLRALEDQLLQFPMGVVNDLVMALWFAELGAKDIWQRQVMPAFDPRFKVPGRIRRQRRVVSFGSGVRLPTPEEEAGIRMSDALPKPKLINVSGVTVY